MVILLTMSIVINVIFMLTFVIMLYKVNMKIDALDNEISYLTKIFKDNNIDKVYINKK